MALVSVSHNISRHRTDLTISCLAAWHHHGCGSTAVCPTGLATTEPTTKPTSMATSALTTTVTTSTVALRSSPPPLSPSARPLAR
eukprot:7391611-Prymnesium_polylepis.2